MRTFFKILLFVSVIFFAENILADDYNDYAKKVREEIWAWDIPEFKNYKVADEYKNESAVILAKHNQLTAAGKKKFRINIALDFNINKELIYAYTTRLMVKINDKPALDKFSEITYREQDKKYGYMMTSNYKTIVGARIIKPDGTIKEINVDEAVSITEGKKDKEDYKKLAISDLQVGDILDYFIQSEGHVDTENIPPLNFVFADKYPMMYYSVHCQIGNKLTIECRSINGAPDFISSTNDDKDIILDAKKTNIPKLEGMERWTSPLREYPTIRLSVLNNSSGKIYKPVTARKSGLYKNLSSDIILSDARSTMGDVSNMELGDIYKRTQKLVDTYKKENPNATNEELASYIYDALQFSWIDYGFGNSAARRFIKALNYFLEKYKIEYKLGFVTNKYGARRNEIANRFDIEFLTTVNNNKQIFTYNPTNLSIAGEYDSDFESETAKMYATPDEFKVPETDVNHNLSITKTIISFSPEDLLLLNIDRSLESRGNLKKSFQSTFFTNEMWNKELRQHLNIKKTVQEELQEKKNTRKYIDDYNELIEKERKALKDKFKEEINNYHDSDPKEISEYNVLHLGVTKENPYFQFNVKYSQEGLVKKAGNNLILDAGKLIGSQLELKDDDRKRNVDIYMATARSYQDEIQIKIPEDYTVENVASLNKNINNNSASFTASATVNGQLLTIKTSKVYKHAFEPLANWGKMLEMIDSAVDFRNQSVILRKK